MTTTETPSFHFPHLYVGGNMRATSEHHDVVCPATDQVIGSIAWADASDTTDALAAAASCFPDWSTRSTDERADWMAKLRTEVIDDEDRLRELVHLENGKTWVQTGEDFQSLVDALDFYARQMAGLESSAFVDRAGTHRHVIERQPVGVVGAFLAWNFPLLNLAFKLAPAMAAGCPIVIKPSFKTPLSTYAVGELCERIGLPVGAVNIVCGPDDVVGDTISSSPIPAMLTVIGSTKTGRHVIRAGTSTIKRYSMELGGNAPAIVHADADLLQATQVIGDLKFGHAGQTCVSPNRVFVHAAVHDSVVAALIERAASIRLGHDRTADIDMGPMIDVGSRDRIVELVEEAASHGATVRHGGAVPPELADRGAFLQPTVVSGVTPEMRLAREEVFGPVVTVIEFGGDDDVIALANDTDAGLASYVFTNDLAVAEATARRLRFGEVHVNGVRYDIELPHGGIKQSGMGVDCSTLALDDYLAPKRISWAVSA